MQHRHLLETSHRIEFEIVGDHRGQNLRLGPFERLDEFDGEFFLLVEGHRLAAPLKS